MEKEIDMIELFLDLETSGNDPVKHSILSVGIVISLNGLIDYQSFYREIKYDELIITPAAISVNNIEFADQAGRIPLNQVDIEAVSFINRYYPEDFNPVAIGLSVGSFDIQFIRRHMPLLAQRLSNTSLDLNSLIYILAEKHNKNFKDLKKRLAEEADNRTVSLGLGVEKHNALFDAVFNLNLYLLIKERLWS